MGRISHREMPGNNDRVESKGSTHSWVRVAFFVSTKKALFNEDECEAIIYHNLGE